jgi:hypothetical protein
LGIDKRLVSFITLEQERGAPRSWYSSQPPT